MPLNITPQNVRASRTSWLNHPNQRFREHMERAVGMLREIERRGDNHATMRAVAAVITPIIRQNVELEDVANRVFGETDWTGVPASERTFRMPAELQGADHVLTYQNGTTLPVAAFNRRSITVQSEEQATPAFPYDVRELRRQDAIAGLQDMETYARRMILIDKTERFYFLVGDGFDDPDANLTVVKDDGDRTVDGMFFEYIPILRDTIEETVNTMQDAIGGTPQIRLLARQVTLNRLLRVGLFGSVVQELDQVRLENALQPIVLPAGNRDPNRRQIVPGESHDEKFRPIFTEGDLLLLGPDVGAYAKTEELEASNKQNEHWMNEVAWRYGFAWVRWSDRGDVNRTRRILVIKTVAAGGAQGVLSMDSLWTTGASFYSSRPIKKSTISNTNIIISASTGGTQATGALTAQVRGDLRHFNVSFATPLTKGTKYYVRLLDTGSDGTADLQDLADDGLVPEVNGVAEFEIVAQ